MVWHLFGSLPNKHAFLHLDTTMGRTEHPCSGTVFHHNAVLSHTWIAAFPFKYCTWPLCDLDNISSVCAALAWTEVVDEPISRPKTVIKYLCHSHVCTEHRLWEFISCIEQDELLQQPPFSSFSGWWHIKGALRSFGEEIRSPERCLRLERWPGPPQINKVKQCESVSSFKVRLFNQSWKQR